MVKNRGILQTHGQVFGFFDKFSKKSKKNKKKLLTLKILYGILTPSLTKRKWQATDVATK